MLQSSSRQRGALLALYGLGVAIATIQRGVLSREHTTFAIFRQSFAHLARHQNLYAAYPAEQGAAAADLFKYSPSAAMLFAPLAVIPYPLALLLWNVLNTALLVFAVTRILPPRRANLALLLLAPEVFVAIQSSSSNGLVTALILLAAIAYEEGRLLRAGYAVVVGAAIKIFPLAALVFGVLQVRRKTAAVATIAALIAVVSLPLLIIPPQELIQQYRWWLSVERTDAADMVFGLSLMRQLRDWSQITWPNWVVQMLGTAFFLLPIALRRESWKNESFRMQYLCSLLVFVVLFNHQAERQSFIIAATGCVLWYVNSRRTVEGAVLLGIGLLGVPTLPYLALWLVIHFELLRGTPSLRLATEPIVRPVPLVTPRWIARYRAAS